MNNISNNILPQKKISNMHLEVSEVLITYVTNRGKARLMLHIGAGPSNNCQITLNPIRPGGGAQRPGWPNSQLPIRNLLSYDAQTW